MTEAGPSSRSADARRAAHRVLLSVSDGAYADRAAETELAGLATRERAFAQELAYGAIRLRGRLDTELNARVDRPLSKLDRSVLEWLRLGLYQIRELRTPPHAAVNETVAGARGSSGRGAAGLVNAVLRAALREDPADLFPALDENPLRHLTSWGSHPDWLVRRWLDAWGVGAVQRLVELDNRTPPVTVRLLEPMAFAEAREAVGEGLTLEPLADWPRSCRLAEGRPADLLDRIRAVIQDPAASAVVDYASVASAGALVDVCAAPGGKAMALAVKHPAARPFIAADVSPSRLARVARAADRLGVDIECVAMDGRLPAMARAGTVLLDAPCTGTGALRRRPDARWRIGPERLSSLTRLQAELLDGCAELVDENGGTLVYATCSLEPEENELQVKRFLVSHPDFRRAPPRAGELPAGSLTQAGDLRIRPWDFGTDGSYACRLVRRAT